MIFHLKYGVKIKKGHGNKAWPFFCVEIIVKSIYIHRMTKSLILKISMAALLIFFLPKSIFAQIPLISTGPYIFLKNDRLKVQWVENGKLKSQENLIPQVIESEFGFLLDPEVVKSKMQQTPDFYQDYKGVTNLVVISDIHGQYDLMVELLRSHGIIDENLNWSFGKGHLVINGDILGRGDKVTEALWLAYSLENQAIEAGGRLHYLLGNHELMLLDNDLRYLNKKYFRTARLMKVSVKKMHNNESVLGNWLRKRPVMITIDSLLITHAGISPEFVNRELTTYDVNQIFYENILNPSKVRGNRGKDISFLTSPMGPIWYRGYFGEDDIEVSELDAILDYFGSQRIIVGHTSVDMITPLFGGRVLAVDSSIKNGRGGEILMIENGELFRGAINGIKFKFP
jgi:hypothetical protein